MWAKQRFNQLYILSNLSVAVIIQWVDKAKNFNYLNPKLRMIIFSTKRLVYSYVIESIFMPFPNKNQMPFDKIRSRMFQRNLKYLRCDALQVL